jgi:LysM repeat protein
VQTIKTAVVVVLLFVVLFMAYVAINGSQTELPQELQKMLTDDTSLGIDVSIPGMSSDASQNRPGAGLTPSNGLPSTSLTSGPSSFWNSPSSGNSAMASPSAAAITPETLTPPKLTSIPSLPSSLAKPSSMTEASSTPPNFEIPTIAPSPLKLDASATSKSDSALPPTLAVIPPSLRDNPTPDAFNDSPVSAPLESGSPNVENSFAKSDPPSGLKMPDALTVSANDSTAKKANLTGPSFENAKKTAIEKAKQGELKNALSMLSVFYNSPELTSEQSQDLLNLLDAIAVEAIYSKRHVLDQPYIVGPGETIDGIAKKFEIPTELLSKINTVDSTLGPMPGTRLKVFQGPFRAEVNLKKNEMTLFLGELYAGRFPISTGADPQPKEGVFQVLDKQRNRNYYGKGGIQIEGGDPRNPFGGLWIDLGQDFSIHGSAGAAGSDGNGLGCISLSPQDAGDVFNMLSRGSQVTVRR